MNLPGFTSNRQIAIGAPYAAVDDNAAFWGGPRGAICSEIDWGVDATDPSENRGLRAGHYLGALQRIRTWDLDSESLAHSPSAVCIT